MKKLLLLINPRAGKSQIRGQLLDVLDVFVKDGYEVSVVTTQKRKDATRLARIYGRRMAVIVCAGGDGTLHETVCGLMRLVDRPLLGYIPAGSTNDFARSLNIPAGSAKSGIKAAARIVSGTPTPIDVGRVNGSEHFVYIAAFGAFTELSWQTPQAAKNVLGHQAYMLEWVLGSKSLKSYPMKVASDEVQLEGDFMFGMVTNTLSVGGFRGLVSRDVALGDGYFEVLLIRTPKSPLDWSGIIASIFAGGGGNAADGYGATDGYGAADGYGATGDLYMGESAEGFGAPAGTDVPGAHGAGGGGDVVAPGDGSDPDVRGRGGGSGPLDWDNEYVHRFKTRSITMTCTEPVDWVLDGEFGGSLETVHIENIPSAVQILC
ncbi:MAG: YegS/Rv2252/BmrU family lipid kinase [Lachnospiraceae bacterium]|jgi:YegS/Rv2252/BmrU family lipid kinase|nr:YegS/Rv2252/BmrU family lipid kinase [Lachnospiraceae bacterium]